MPVINIPKKEFRCDKCDFSTTSCFYLDRHLNSATHKNATGPLYLFKCNICNYKSNSNSNYTRHMASKLHITKEKRIEQLKANDFFCASCVYGTSDKSNYERHLKSDKHKKNAYSGYYKEGDEAFLGQEL